MEKQSANLEKSGSKIGQVNRQLRSYDANFKMMVIHETESSNNRQVSVKYGVTECNVRRWSAQKDCLKNADFGEKLLSFQLYLINLRKKHSCPLDQVDNADQTPVFIEMQTPITVHKKGKKSVIKSLEMRAALP